MLKTTAPLKPEQLVTLAKMLGKLKTLKRTGWTNYDIPLPESVADHSFGVALLAMFMAPYFEVDAHKALRMAVLHDLGEAVIGDVITQRGNKVMSNEQEKHRIERD